ncbi:MAG: hypothetical protein GEU94_01570 [Micromonosporaceae bacterium]|nr:hypothetical protein [Micromonosporaceae bacterium]
MECEQVRAALSALLDGEDPPMPAQAAIRHVAGCPECRAWQARAEQVTRSVRARSVEAPDLTERVLAAVSADAAARAGAGQVAATRVRGRAKTTWLRWTVAVIAVTQIVLAVPELLGIPSLHFGHGHGLHAGREDASFDIAVAVGFLLVARFPERARALAPVAIVLAAFLTVTSGIDLLSARTTLLHEVGHGLVVLQAGLMWGLSRDGGSRLAVRPRAA